MNKLAIGVDIGGTNTAMGVVDSLGNVVLKSTLPTPVHGDVHAFVSDMAVAILDMVDAVTKLNEQSVVQGIGIGAPNGNYYSGTIEHAPNLSFKGIVPLVDLIKAKFPTLATIALTNDANAAAIGEMIYGGAKGMKHFAMYTLGTGVGSGLVVNGALVYGHDGFAGECGHTTLIPGGRRCGCGGLGHLEAYCSASGMKRTAMEIVVRDNATDSPLADIPYNVLDSKMIYDAAKAGDNVAKEVFAQTGYWLGQAMADTVHHISPEAIFLFGGPTAAGELLFKPIKESLEAHLLPVFRNKVKVLPSSLKPGDAAIVGASALVYAK